MSEYLTTGPGGAAATEEKIIDKHLAASRLGLSPRRVLELADEGKLAIRLCRNPKSGKEQKMLVAADVDRLVEERAMVALPPHLAASMALTVAAPTAVAPSHQAAAPPPHGAAPTRESSARQAFDAVPPCAFLTLDQGAAYTGLPAAFLAARIRTNALKALDVGIRPGGRWRIHRADLDAIAGEVVPLRALSGPERL